MKAAITRRGRSLQLRGEYLYAAQGKEGFWAYDAASIANKGVSHRVIRAPVSPLVVGDRPSDVSVVVVTAVGFYGNASAIVLTRG